MLECDIFLSAGYLLAVHSLSKWAVLLISPGIDNASEYSVYLSINNCFVNKKREIALKNAKLIQKSGGKWNLHDTRHQNRHRRNSWQIVIVLNELVLS